MAALPALPPTHSKVLMGFPPPLRTPKPPRTPLAALAPIWRLDPINPTAEVQRGALIPFFGPDSGPTPQMAALRTPGCGAGGCGSTKGPRGGENEAAIGIEPHHSGGRPQTPIPSQPYMGSHRSPPTPHTNVKSLICVISFLALGAAIGFGVLSGGIKRASRGS